MLSQPPLVVLGLPRPFITTRGGGGELCSNPSFPQEGKFWFCFCIIGGIPPLYRLLPRGGEGESSARSPPFPRGYLWFFGLSAGSLRCIGYLCCPSRACVCLSVCAHLFWRNHPPTTLIFNKDPPPSSSQHDRRRSQSRQHSFSSFPGRAVCCRR